MTTLEQSPTTRRPVKTQRTKAQNSQRLFTAMILAILIVGSVVMLLPFVWLVISSLKPLEKVFIFPPEWIPNPPQWQNYVDALVYKPFGTYLFNTLRIAILNEIAILLTASFCGYGFARIRFPGRDFWFALVLVTLMVPYFVLMVPQFIMFSRFGWVDTFLPLTFPFFFGGGAFNIFLFRQFFRSLPEELADAGRIDGSFGIWHLLENYVAFVQAGAGYGGDLHVSCHLERLHWAAALSALRLQLHRGDWSCYVSQCDEHPVAFAHGRIHSHDSAGHLAILLRPALLSSKVS